MKHLRALTIYTRHDITRVVLHQTHASGRFGSLQVLSNVHSIVLLQVSQHALQSTGPYAGQLSCEFASGSTPDIVISRLGC